MGKININHVINAKINGLSFTSCLFAVNALDLVLLKNLKNIGFVD